MKNKLISISIVLVLIFTSLISVEAIAPTPRIDLDEYQFEATDINNVFVTGTITISKGQLIGLYDSSEILLYNYKQVSNTNSEEDFKIQIPKLYLKEGTNTFKVKSLPIKGVINSSNPKTVTVKINSSKKNQTISVKDLTLKINEKKNINATVSSGLPLTYKSADPNIATIDTKGDIIGRKVGTVKITITQAGNNEYNPVNKTITLTVKNNNSSTPTTNKKDQNITTNFDRYQFDNIKKSIDLKAKANSGLSLTYKSSNSKVASIDSKGEITSKSSGTAVITITQSGNSKYKAVTKKVTVVVPKIQNRDKALQPWYDALTEQINWQKNAKYNWSKWRSKGGDVAASKYYGTCITLPSASLQRLGLLPKGGFVAGVTSKSNRKKSLNYMSKNPGYITNKDVNSSIRKLAKNNVIQKGDILHSKNHTWVYMGPANSKKTKFVFWECGNSSKGSNKAHKHTVKRNPTVRWVNRINCYDIYTSCKNGTITGSNLYMASQTIKITYKPIEGKKLKSVTVDGKSVDISKHPTSYTFKKLSKNHNVKVIFN